MALAAARNGSASVRYMAASQSGWRQSQIACSGLSGRRHARAEHAVVATPKAAASSAKLVAKRGSRRDLASTRSVPLP